MANPEQFNLSAPKENLEKETIRIERENFAGKAWEKLEEELKEQGLKIELQELHQKEPERIEEGEDGQNPLRKTSSATKRQIAAAILTSVLASQGAKATEAAHQGEHPQTDEPRNEQMTQVNYAQEARAKWEKETGAKVEGPPDPEEKRLDALWEQLVKEEAEKQLSFITSEAWKKLDSSKKAALIDRIVDADFDKKDPIYTSLPFVFARHYINEPQAKEILVKAAREDWKKGLAYYKEYEEAPWAQAIIEEALLAGNPPEARRQLWYLVQRGKLEGDIAYKLEKIIDERQEQIPIEVIIENYTKLPQSERFDFFHKGTWQELNLEKKGAVLIQLLKRDPEIAAHAVFLYFPLISRHPSIETIMGKAADIMPRTAIDECKLYYHKDIPWARPILEEALMKDPYSAVRSFEKYKDLLPNAEEKLREVLAQDPSAGVRYFEAIKNFPWAEEFLKETLERKPGLVIFDFQSFKEHVPWAEEVMKKAIERVVKEEPQYALEYIYQYKEFPWAEEQIKLAAEKDPDAAFKYFKNYKHFLWANAIFLAERAKEASVKAVSDFLNSPEGKLLSREEREKISNAVSELAHIASPLLERNRSQSYLRFRQDPAVEHTPEVKAEWIPADHIDKSDPATLAQHRIIIARNLYFQNKDITPQTVKEESERIFEMREKFKNIPLFEGRNIIVAAHGEAVPEFVQDISDRKRFGKNALIAELQLQQGDYPQNQPRPQLVLERPAEDTRTAIENAKSRTLENIRTLPSPMTFIFDGHGGPEGLYFSQGETTDSGDVAQTETWRHISPEELAQAFIERYKRKTKEMFSQERDIIILSSCYNTTYLRKLYTLLEQADVPKPIAIGASEYGQLGYSDWELPTGGEFMENTILRKDEGGGKATVGSVIEHDVKQKVSNPSVYIPDEKNRPMQLSEEKDDAGTQLPA